jgi:hypothetical protein
VAVALRKNALNATEYIALADLILATASPSK